MAAQITGCCLAVMNDDYALLCLVLDGQEERGGDEEKDRIVRNQHQVPIISLVSASNRVGLIDVCNLENAVLIRAPLNAGRGWW